LKPTLNNKPLRLNSKRAVTRERGTSSKGTPTAVQGLLLKSPNVNEHYKDEKAQKFVNALRLKFSRGIMNHTQVKNQAKPAIQQNVENSKIQHEKIKNELEKPASNLNKPSHENNVNNRSASATKHINCDQKQAENLAISKTTTINLFEIMRQTELNKKLTKKTVDKNRHEELDRLKVLAKIKDDALAKTANLIPSDSIKTKQTIPAPNLSSKETQKPEIKKTQISAAEPVKEEKKHETISGKIGNLSDYVVGRMIGQGAYACVRLSYNKAMGKKLALKVYEKKKLIEPQRQKSVYREIRLLQKMNHVNIVKLYDAFDTDNHVILAMEYVRGNSLHSYLKAQPNRTLDEWEAKRLFRQVVCGIEYCHGKSIAHRDIKLENLLLDEHNNVKIIDFGFSTCMPNTKKIKIFCGTPSYMSPEIVLRKEYAGPQADVWALGVLLYAMLCGTFPFKGRNDRELYKKISNVLIVYPDHLSGLAKNLLQRIFQLDPDKRPTAHEIMNDPWLSTTSDKDFLNTPKSASNAINLEAYMAYYSDPVFPPRDPPPVKIQPNPGVNNSNINIITNITHINLPSANNSSLSYNNSDYSISSSKMGSQNSLMKSNLFDISKASIDNELLGSILKLGYSIDEIKQQMQNENSHICRLYNKLLGERKLVNVGIAPSVTGLGSSIDVLNSSKSNANGSSTKLNESNNDILNQTAPLADIEKTGIIGIKDV